MNKNHFIESELAHLENVLAHPLGKPFTADYWHVRIGALIDMAVVQNHKVRLERLRSRLVLPPKLELAA
jgi:hypothetical protein